LNLKAMNILRFATILIALIGSVSLSIASLAFAQSDEDSTPSVSESDSIPPPPAADYLKLPPASSESDSIPRPPVADYLKLPPTSDSLSGTTDPDWEEVPETILGPPPPVADDLKVPPTLATDGFSGAAGRFLGATHELEVPETNSDSIAEHGQVLEIPQAVNAALIERIRRR
jgi:hypothetical protein